jgi:tetratricopeptide (TPR) repeat protein
VRRRSGKVFGPFAEAQIVEMLSKGELLGNEDVSLDGESYSPIGAVQAFGAALRKATAEPAPRSSPPAVFGDRMAGAKVVEGQARRPMPRWLKPVLLALPGVLLVAAGVGAGFTRHGFFFAHDLFQRGDPVALANLVGQARTALGRGDHPSTRIALDHAAKAVAASPGSSEAMMLRAAAAAALELGHGAPPDALAQARKDADLLEHEEKGDPATLATRLAVHLAAEPVAATAAEEAALEAAVAKRNADPEVVALLARSALARGDGVRAAAQGAKLAGMERGPRGPLFQAQAAILKKNAGEARAALAKALERDPNLAAAHVELAALDEQAGELAKARDRLEPLAADSAKPRLSPAERARVLAILGSIAGREPARAAEADKLLEDAVSADPRSTDSRIRLIHRKIQEGDPAGAVAASDAVAQTAAQQPALAAARVRALALDGKMLDAATLADQALQANPGRVELMMAKAVTLVAAGKPAEGKRLYEDALARDPEAVEARVALARIALQQNDLGRAGELLAVAVQKGPRDASAQAATGDLLLAKGDRAGAEAAYRKALELEPAHAPAEVGLAHLALAKGDVAAARSALGRAVKYDPHNADILVDHATLLWKAGELDAAKADLEAAIDAVPRHALALSRLGAVLLQKGDADGAVRRLTAATGEAPELVEARYWLGQALLARSEWPSAIVQLRRAVDLARTSENLLALGGAFEKSGSLADALESYQAAAAVAPDSADPQERLALLLAQNSRCDQALPAFERAIELAPKLSRLKLGQAQCTAQLRKHEEAARLLQDLLKVDPGATQAYYLLARSLHESKGAAAALPWYERAAKEEPQNPMPHYYLGYAYKERKLRSKAVEEFRKFLKQRPDAPERKDIEAEIEDLGGK